MTRKSAPKLADVLAAIERIAPRRLAEEWDNVGLQTGRPDAPAGTIMTALEVTREVIEEAARRNAATLVVHHPLIFRPLKTLAETNAVTELLADLVRCNIALIAAHTNLDSVLDGTNGVMADLIGIESEGRKPLFPNALESANVKYAVFVPASHADAVIDAIASAGARVIGDYTHCTFHTQGTGTFLPTEGARPFSGAVGKMELAEELRIECVCPRRRLSKLIDAVARIHPYEEVAFDVYTLEPTGDSTTGLGIVGTLKKPTTVGAFARAIKKALRSPSIGVVGDADASVRRVAILTGAGGEAIRRWRPGIADVLVTGEMNHHDCHEARHRGVPAILAGHWESEVIVAPRLAELLAEELKMLGFPSAQIIVAESETRPVERR